ncbi:uncharacterized protein V1516DRAFT_680326 [Lipomyces oligophaga]|uniref:uncharacterized protein n=1 Tax=Lipomyces oligophaga TaxID=45792 RepID=UPI0034CEE405
MLKLAATTCRATRLPVGYRQYQHQQQSLLSFAGRSPTRVVLNSVSKSCFACFYTLAPLQMSQKNGQGHVEIADAKSDHQDHEHEHKHEHEHEHEHEHNHKGHDHNHQSHSLFHSHTHTHDNTLLISSDTSNPGVRITRVGLAVNVGMAVVKGIGGYVFNSKSLMADAVHALSDLLSDLLTLATVSVALRHPTSSFPRGFGKVEALGSLGVSGMLVLAGFGIGINGLETLITHFNHAADITVIDPFASDLLHVEHDSFLHDLLSHSHAHDHSSSPDLNAAWLAAGSIAIKEWLFQRTMAIAIANKSTVLAANAWHHRVDCLTSIVALLAITGSHFLHLDWLDPVGGVLVSGTILHAGYNSGKQAVLELADHEMPTEISDEARVLVDEFVSDFSSANSTVGAIHILSVNGIKSGPVLSFDVDLRLFPSSSTSVSLADANAVASDLRSTIVAQIHGVRSVNIRAFDQHDQDISVWIDSKI